MPAFAIAAVLEDEDATRYIGQVITASNSAEEALGTYVQHADKKNQKVVHYVVTEITHSVQKHTREVKPEPEMDWNMEALRAVLLSFYKNHDNSFASIDECIETLKGIILDGTGEMYEQEEQPKRKRRL